MSSHIVEKTYLVVPLEGSPELTNQPDEDKLSDLGQLGVDDGDKSGEDGREGDGRCLSLHDGPSEQSSSSDEVLSKQLGDNVLDVGNIDLQRDEKESGTRSAQLPPSPLPSLLRSSSCPHPPSHTLKDEL